MRDTWPECLKDMGMSTNETIGDLVEALLALFWLFRRHGKHLPQIAHWFLEQLEKLIMITLMLEQPSFVQSLSSSRNEGNTVRSEVCARMASWHVS